MKPLSTTLAVLTLSICRPGMLPAQPSSDDKPPTTAAKSCPSRRFSKPGSFVLHDDGHLMFIRDWDVRRSRDGGLTWTDEEPFLPDGLDTSDLGMDAVLRLQSGRLAVIADEEKDPNDDNFVVNRLFCWTTDVDGKAWQGPFPMNPAGTEGLPYRNSLIQTSKGRLVLPVRLTHQAHSRIEADSMSMGTRDGEQFEVTEHARYPELDVTFCYLSDDEGKTWFRSKREIFVWKDEGRGGMWPMDEPCVVERKDGDLLLFGRTTLGRLYQCRSSDGGVRWSLPEPTELASSYSPCRVVRLPATGDLLCLWNQVSPAEIEAGYWRSRLSSAISRDDGATWESFRTVDVMGLEPAGRIVPEAPRMVRPADHIGEMPADYGNVDYPNFGFYEDQVLITYKRNLVWMSGRDRRLVIVPTQWFYE